MNFLRLHDDLPSVLFEDDDIIAIDKPYGFNAHTNDSKIEHSEFIQDGLIEIFEKLRGEKLHIIHRLDQTTTGVMIFGKSVESAKKYADFFFQRQVKKTYWFLTKNKSQTPSFLIDDVIVHKGKELDAKTQLTLIRRSDRFELWKANPFTGRNHQIRIHAKSALIPILGDSKYGGAQFPFLCLHNHRIEFPNGIVITSKPPVYYEDMEILEDFILTKTLFESDRRLRLFTGADSSECFRLVHSSGGDKNQDFTIDQWGPVMVLNWNKETWNTEDLKKFTEFSLLMKKTLLVRFPQSPGKSTTAPNQIVIDPNKQSEVLLPTWRAQEGSTQYELRSDAGSVGLFSNQRLHRRWVRHNSQAKSVLSLFANTGAYSVAAALGGSSQVTAVEMSKASLGYLRRNFELNAVPTESHKFLCRDSVSYIEQCKTKGLKYDLIICDTPSFMKREKGLFKIKTDLQALLKNCLLSLNPGGQLLFSTTFDGFFISDLQKMILGLKKTQGLSGLELSCILPALDFETPNEKAQLKSFLIQRT